MKMRKRACVAGAFCLGLTLSVGATTWTYTPGKENPNIIGTVTDGQWTPSEAETQIKSNTNGFFVGKPFTDNERKMIAADPALAKAFGVLVEYREGKLVRQAFFVHKPSPHDPKGFALPFR